MAPVSKKRKFSPTDKVLDLTTIAKLNPNLPEVLKSTLSMNPDPLMVTVLERIQEELYGTENITPTQYIQANKLKSGDVQRYLGVDYRFGDHNYRWLLKDCADMPKPLSEWTSTTIRKLQQSKYGEQYQLESFTRTIFDILLFDRLEKLDDEKAKRHLRIATEVSMEVSTKTKDGIRKISGRADWTLGYMDDRKNLHEMLVVIEAKAYAGITAAMPQLLAYLAGIQDARSAADKTNKVVFGIATDFVSFSFVVLRENRKAFTSKLLDWIEDQEKILAFFDHILRDAIETSPHTTPIKSGNKRIGRFDTTLGMDYAFGYGPDNSGDSDNEKISLDGEYWDVVEDGPLAWVVPCHHQEHHD